MEEKTKNRFKIDENINKGFFSFLFLLITCILILFSVLAIISIHWSILSNINIHISISPKGINNYLRYYFEYKSLFSITIATVAAYYGILRLKIATDTYKDKLKQDRFDEFKFILQSRLSEIEVKNPFMKREFERIRHKLFNKLYEKKFSLSNKQDLIDIFNEFFKERVKAFEREDREFKNINVYDTAMSSYSFDNFRFVFLSCVDSYIGISRDLQVLYIENMDKKRRIDGDEYTMSAMNYGKRL